MQLMYRPAEELSGIRTEKILSPYELRQVDERCSEAHHVLPQGERRIRGTAIYPVASCINHECLPNVARLDDFDARNLRYPQNTAVSAS